MMPVGLWDVRGEMSRSWADNFRGGGVWLKGRWLKATGVISGVAPYGIAFIFMSIQGK